MSKVDEMLKYMPQEKTLSIVPEEVTCYITLEGKLAISAAYKRICLSKEGAEQLMEYLNEYYGD